MDISAGAATDVNLGLNIGNLMQMFEMVGLDQSAAKGSNAETATGKSFENILLQVLQQNMPVLLQCGKTENSPELKAEDDLLKALQKLMQENQTAAGEILSGLSLLAIAGKSEGLVAGEIELSEDAFLPKPAEPGVASILKDEMNATKEQIKLTMHQDEKRMLFPKTIDPVVAENNIQQDIAAESNEKDKSINAPKQETTASVKDAPQNLQHDDAEVKGLTSAVSQDKVPILKDIKEELLRHAGSDVVRRMSPQEQMLNTTRPEHLDNTANGYGDLQRKAANEGKDKTLQIKSAENTSAVERPLGENQNVKVNATPAVVVQNDKQNMDIFSGRPIQEDSLTPRSMKDEAEQTVREKFFAKPDSPAADKKSSLPINDTQKNVAAKITASMPESAGMIEKFKTESKNKTAPGEKNLESNSLNATAASGPGTARIKSIDVSPAQIIERVAAHFNEGLLSDGGRVKITLAPPSLGTLEMDVMVRNGSVKVMLIADNKDVQQMLSGNLDSLKGSLQSQGLTIERCDVMTQDRREQYSQSFNQHQTFNQESSAKHHYDDGEGYSQDKQTVIPSKIKPLDSTIASSGKISLFI